MQPLLKIQSIPIKIEAQTKRASLQHSTDPAPAPRPVRSAPQRPAPAPAPAPQQRPAPQPQPEQRVNQQSRNVQQRSAADQATSYMQEASDAVQSHNQNVTVGGAPVSEAAYTPPVDIDYSTSAVASAPAPAAPATSFDYSMDRETFDWNANAKPQLEYIPASIEYSISQYPEVVIEYVGEPIYVPASSNPNYVPPPETKGKA